MSSVIKYPSINQFRHMIRSAFYMLGNNELSSSTLVFEGTVKLHGTNSGIVFHFDGTNSYQSKNHFIDIGSDNAGFAGYMRGIENTESFKEFRNCVMDFADSDPDQKNDVVVYGEWCGEGIQKGVGINDIGKKIFVIFGVSIGIDTEYNDFCNMKDFNCHYPDLNIFNIRAFPTFHVEVDINFPQIAQQQMIEFVNEVENECPVAKSFGIDNGCGEGIVWTHVDFPELMYKTKGQKHSVSKVTKLADVDVEHVKNIQEFVTYAVTPNRLEQGIEYLHENKIPLEMKSTGDFIRWVFNDVIKEESDVMEENGIVKKELGKYLNYAVREFWAKRLDEEVGL